VPQNVDDGEPIDAQTAGDCRQIVCDGEGDTRRAADADDAEDDDNPCTVDACDGTTSTHEPEPEGTACDVDDGVVCDGQGECVECVDEGDCDGDDVCQSGMCVLETCTNEEQDGDETDEDCGGPDCAPCGPNEACVDDDDCAGDDCSGLVCVPNCQDGVQNNDEAAVDCGEGCSGGCASGTPCDEAVDCSSAFCDPDTNQCASTGDCFDDTHNGDETDEDCGGTDCDPCGPNLMCEVDDDCAGDDCGSSDTCVPNCADGAQNNTEVDVDCGPGCSTCSNGRDCTLGTHCTSGICIGDTCTDLNGCTVGASLDRRLMSGVTIQVVGTSYSPSCIRVSVGTVVTVEGSSGTHPFVGGRIVSSSKQPASSGPFMGSFTASDVDFTMNSAGNFGFYCDNHGVSSNMKGAVLVVP
jgi:plastocyanin